MLRPFLLAVPVALLVTGSGIAQQPVIERRMETTGLARSGEVRVSVNMSFFVPSSVSDTDAATKAQEQARRVLYENAARECELLRATIAAECRLESVNVNMNRNYPGNQPEGFNANGNFGFRVTLK